MRGEYGLWICEPGEELGCPTDCGCDDCDNDNDGVTIAQGDCDDSNGAVHPGATEVCDGVDNDCDGAVDENAGCGVP